MENETEGVLKYADKVSLAIVKYARNLSRQEQADIRQEAYLALVQAGDRITGPGFAYKVARNKIINILKKRKNIGREWSLSDLAVQREVDSVVPEQVFSGLDAEVVVELLNKLPHTDRYVIEHLFGVNRNQLTEVELAMKINKSVWWVSRRKEFILEKLRSMIECPQ